MVKIEIPGLTIVFFEKTKCYINTLCTALNDKSFLPLIPEKFHNKDYGGIQRAVRAARVPPEHLPTTFDHLQDNATLTAITKQAQTAQARAKRKK